MIVEQTTGSDGESFEGWVSEVSQQVWSGVTDTEQRARQAFMDYLRLGQRIVAHVGDRHDQTSTIPPLPQR